MSRAPASRLLLIAFRRSTIQSPAANVGLLKVQRLQLTSKLCTLSSRRPTAPAVVVQRLLRREYADRGWEKDIKHEQEYGKKKITPHPELVSATSSVHSLFEEVGTKERKDDVDMAAGIKGDLRTVRETFNLSEVPRQALVLGLAGLLPYLGTSLGTVYCAFEVNYAHAMGTGYIFTEEQATYALHLLEHLQIGYGAVIISFLGAIHWGLEWAGYGGTQGYRRYAIGVIAPAIAWPTTLLPHTYALITQFLAFNWLYYSDARATRRGWTPPWYGTYRFVLTFIVGASIVISLIGRGEIAHKRSTMPKAADRISGLHDTYEEAFKAEEKARTALLVSKGKAKSVEPEAESVDELEDDDAEDDEEAGKDGNEEGEEGKKDEKKSDKKEKKDNDEEEEEDDEQDDKDEKKDDKKSDKKDEKKDDNKDEKKDEKKGEDKKDKKDDKDQDAKDDKKDGKNEKADDESGDDESRDEKSDDKDKKGKK